MMEKSIIPNVFILKFQNWTERLSASFQLKCLTLDLAINLAFTGQYHIILPLNQSIIYISSVV